MLLRRLRFVAAVLLSVALLIVSLPTAWGETAPEVVPPSLNLKVMYGKPTKDGRLDAWLTVSCDKGSGANAPDTARDVVVEVQASEEIEFLDVTCAYEIEPRPENVYLLHLHDMASRTSERCTLRMKYKLAQPLDNVFGSVSRRIMPMLDVQKSDDEDEQEPKPQWLRIKLTSKNYGSAEYGCDLDLKPSPRMLILANDTSGGTITAMQNNAAMVERCYDQLYYNKEEIEITSFLPGDFDASNTFMDRLGTLSTWDLDENDITYIYVNVHGLAGYTGILEGESLPVMSVAAPAREFIYHDKTYHDLEYCSYEELLGYLDKNTKGFVVLLVDSCYSGHIIDAAQSVGLDTDRFLVVSSTSKEANSPGSASGFTTAGGLHIVTEGGAFTICLANLDGYQPLGQELTYASAKDLINSCSLLKDLILNGHLDVRKMAVQSNFITTVVGYLSSLFDKDLKHHLSTTHISPRSYGNQELPVQVYSDQYDNGWRILAVKNETFRVYPPEPLEQVILLNGLREIVDEDAEGYLTLPTLYDSSVNGAEAIAADLNELSSAVNGRFNEAAASARTAHDAYSDYEYPDDYMPTEYELEYGYWEGDYYEYQEMTRAYQHAFAVRDVYASPGVLNLRVQEADFQNGTSRPDNSDTNISYDLETGARLNVPDLLDPDRPGAAAALAELIAGRYEGYDLWIEPEEVGESVVSGRIGNWIFTSEGWLLYFDYEEIALAISGTMDELFTYEELSGIFAPRFLTPNVTPADKSDVCWILAGDSRFTNPAYTVYGRPENAGAFFSLDGAATDVTVTVTLDGMGRYETVLFYANTLENAVVCLPRALAGDYTVRWTSGGRTVAVPVGAPENRHN